MVHNWCHPFTVLCHFPSCWVYIYLQSNLGRLYQDLQLEDSSLWSSFARSSQCEQEFPSMVAKKVSLFQQVLMVQATRPDRLQSGMSLFACKSLGKCRWAAIDTVDCVTDVGKWLYICIVICRYTGFYILYNCSCRRWLPLSWVISERTIVIALLLVIQTHHLDMH